MNPNTNKTTIPRDIWIVVAVCGICLFTSLGASHFWDQDEGFFAGTAASMFAKSEWIVPSFNGEMFGHKPPWMYWMMMIGYSLFGVGEFGERFFSAVFGLATALLLFRVGTRLFNPRVGMIAGVALPSCLMFSVVSHAATPDVFLVFFSTLALYLYACDGLTSPFGGSPAPSIDGAGKPSYLPKRWSTWAWMYAVMGLAALVKGPIGFLFPMAVIGLFLLIMTPGPDDLPKTTWQARIGEPIRRFGPVNFFKTIWLMRPFTAIAMILLVAGPWYLAVGLLTGGAFHAEFFGVHHWQRFTTPMDNHSGTIFYYLIAILIGMFPWSIYGGPALLEWVRQLRQRNENFASLVFLGCWAGVYLGLFSLASTKLPNYVLPAYPALALMVALFIDSALTRCSQKDVSAAGVSFGGMVFIGVLLLAVLPIVAWIRFDGQTILERAELVESSQILLGRLAWIGLPLLVGGVLAIRFARTQRLHAAFVSASVASVAFMVIFWNDSVPHADQYQTPQQIATQFQELTRDRENARLAQLGLFRPSMVYYGGGRVHECETEQHMLEFLASAEYESYAVTTSERFGKLQHLHAQLEVVARQPDFPKQGELLLLRQRVATATQEPVQRR